MTTAEALEPKSSEMPALDLALMDSPTDTAADAGKRMVLLEEFQSLPVFARIDQGDETLNADMGRARSLAGRRAAFADGECAGNGLGILLESRLSRGKGLVVFIRNADGANLGAFAAAGAFGKINISGLLPDPGRKTAGISAEIQKLGLGQ